MKEFSFEDRGFILQRCRPFAGIVTQYRHNQYLSTWIKGHFSKNLLLLWLGQCC
jgi:hypothetical protein